MADALLSFLETRLALWNLLRSAYAAPIAPDLAEALAEAALLYDRLVDREIPPLVMPDPAGESPEFHRLFVGPGALVAPPYESLYRSHEPLLMQEETLRVRAFYAAHGLALSPGVNEPDDHLLFELEFYAHLQEQTLAAITASSPAEAERLAAVAQRFWTEHLNQWVPAFCKRIIEGSRSPWYRSLARITREVLLAERQVLGALIEPRDIKKEVVL